MLKPSKSLKVTFFARKGSPRGETPLAAFSYGPEEGGLFWSQADDSGHVNFFFQRDLRARKRRHVLWPRRIFAREDFDGRAGHEDAGFGLRPLEFEVPAGQVGEDLAVGSAGEYAGNTDGGGSGAAGEGDAAAAFPGSHGDLCVVVDLDEVDVDASREGRVVFEQWPDLRQWNGGDVVDVENQVGVAHGDGGYPVGEPGLLDGLGGFGVGLGPVAAEQVLPGVVDDAVESGGGDGNAGGVELGPAHVDGDLRDAAGSVEGVAELEDTGAGLDADGVVAADVGGDLVVVGQFAGAADTVAAHLRLASVGVEHPHAEVGAGRVIGREQEDQPVGADAEMAIGDVPGEFGRVIDPMAEGVDVDVVISDAVHFVEMQSLVPPERRGEPVL